ncbi:MAG: hypothetical protein PHO42_01725 [Candidatus Omnitrophica bacterium]|nr:hypothetical protein [Candidatus Omnitrophota bacterium]
MRKNILVSAILAAGILSFFAPNIKADMTDPEAITIPKDAGLIREIFKGDEGKLVINIQDAHCNFEAQTNISRILEALVKNGLRAVALEGSFGKIDPSMFVTYPNEEIRREVALDFMKQGKINGAEFFAITSKDPPRLYGVETKEYYLANLSAFLNTLEDRKKIKAAAITVKNVLDKLRDRVYSKSLLQFDEMSQANKKGTIELLDYCKYLKAAAEANRLPLGGYPNLALLYETIDMEKALDVNAEEGRRARIYTTYMKIYKNVDMAALLNEIVGLEEAIKAGLFMNNDQRALDRILRNARVLENMLDISMPKEDFEYYQKNRSFFSSKQFIDFIKEKAKKYGVSSAYDPDFSLIDNLLPDLENFYRIADARDEAIMDNTLKKIEENKVSAIALIAGGYHTKGITARLRKRGISYVVISPCITRPDTNNPYLETLSGE